MAVQDFRQLEVWKEAMQQVVLVYQHTKAFPRDEVYGLTSQLRRASVSVPSNIAEGQGRRTTKDFLSFLYIARSSVLEIQSQIEIATRLKYLDSAATNILNNQATVVVRLVNGLINALNRKLGT